jgi:hypothetical protein
MSTNLWLGGLPLLYSSSKIGLLAMSCTTVIRSVQRHRHQSRVLGVEREEVKTVSDTSSCTIVQGDLCAVGAANPTRVTGNFPVRRPRTSPAQHPPGRRLAGWHWRLEGLQAAGWQAWGHSSSRERRGA